MKKSKLLLTLILFPVLVFADTILIPITGKTVKLSWDAVTKNTDGSNATNIGGYKIFWGASSGNYSQGARDVGNVTSYILTLSDYGNEYFAVKAYNTAGLSSVYSNEAGAKLSPPATLNGPANLVAAPPA